MTRKGNGRPQESALDHSQKIVAGCMKMRQLTDGSGDGRRKKNKSGEDGSY